MVVVDNLKYALRRLAEHLRVAGLAGAAGIYTIVSTHTDDWTLAASLGMAVWCAAVVCAFLFELMVGEGAKK